MSFFNKHDDKQHEQAAEIEETSSAGEQPADQQSQEPQSSELEACRADAAHWKDRYLRTRADLDNVARRVEKERVQMTALVQSEVLLDLLAIVDDFDRALEEHKKHDATPEKQAWLAGFAMIRVSLAKLLERYGVVPMQAYTTFDPMLHEAIAQMAVEGKETGAIVDVAQKGYLRNAVLLRPAKVVVAK